MVKKKAASSGSKPTSAPSNTPQAPSDEQPKKSMARELLQRAFDGLSAFRNLTSRLVLSTEEKTRPPIGFSSVKPHMLDELDICVGHLDFDMEKLLDIAATRHVSERFKLDQTYVRSAGLSMKEQLASIASANYLFESIFHMDSSNILKNSFNVKILPELTIPEGIHKSPKTGVQYTFHGVADFVTFLVQQTEDLDARDIKDLLSQQFIMTDSEHWKFCLYQPETRTCYLLPILKAETHGAAAILTVLEEWVWYSNNTNSRKELWKVRLNRRQKV
ncbi:hypothetical protein PLEOSDRAFT_1109786 [Pleurotus ostreatus PC15]|uniref:Uncharacterized protein n=1 Tax=Pleurotus ostreatus (strain PC15) TaxID=1137138 RepID=A0A067NFY4_PLEO1|nr:hypothetical protein PLEOSDRAFT_1109786 [Pleurotus ostreatus PC15]